MSSPIYQMSGCSTNDHNNYKTLNALMIKTAQYMIDNLNSKLLN